MIDLLTTIINLCDSSTLDPVVKKHLMAAARAEGARLKVIIDDFLQDPFTDEEIRLIECARYISAIKTVRSRLSLGLHEAKTKVDDFINAGQYYYLKQNDIFEEGDEFCNENTAWLPANCCIGDSLAETTYYAGRRLKCGK